MVLRQVWVLSCAFILFTPFIHTAPLSSEQPAITDWAGITTTQVEQVYAPYSVTELQHIVRQAAATKKQVSIIGAGFSQGGQTAIKNGIAINMQHLNAVRRVDPSNKKITVQAGATWQHVQRAIDPFNLSVTVMQSYSNFSVGGSLSVNVHGRHNGHGQIIDTVESMKMVLADGSLVTVSRHENYDLFRAAIGGYGYLGIIVEVTLNLTDNIPLQRSVKLMPLDKYASYFINQVKNNPTIKIQNGSLYPDAYGNVLSIEWHTTSQPLTINERFITQTKASPKQMLGLQIARRVGFTKKIRAAMEPKILNKQEVAMRNYVMAEDTHSLEALINFPTTHILQEYFVPCDMLEQFVQSMRAILNFNKVNVLNCSIRFVPANTESLLSYARQDSFAFVLYINILNTESGKAATKQWTQALIDQALLCDGSFYLPYLLSARPGQIRKAYPEFKTFLAIKQKFDPQGVFSNEMFKKYA